MSVAFGHTPPTPSIFEGELYSKHSTQEGLQKEIDKSFDHILVMTMDIEHLSGKEAIEIVREKRDLE